MSFNDEILVEFENVTKSYSRYGGAQTIKNFLDRIKNGQFKGKMVREKDFLALDDVSFTIRRGEKVGFIGHNGAGKSTTLKLVNSIAAATSGKIKVHGRVGGLIELGSGFHQDLSGRENVFLNAAVQGLSKEETQKIFVQIENIADIGHFIDVPIKRYSSGMKVRLGFAVAIASTPDIVLLDEVLSVGDAAFKKKSMRIMEEYLSQKTLIFVSHSMGQIKKICERVIVLNHGKISFDGPAKEAVAYYNSLVEKSSWTDKTEIVAATKRGFAVAPPVEVKGVELDNSVVFEELNEIQVAQGDCISGTLNVHSETSDFEAKIVLSVRRNVLGGITTIIDNMSKDVLLSKGENNIPFKIEMKNMPCAMYQLNASAENTSGSKKFAKIIHKKKFCFGERKEFQTDKLVNLNIQLT